MGTVIAPQPSTPYRLFRGGARDYDIDPPDIGEAIMLRLPFAVTLGLPSIISSGVTGANGSNYHLCFVAGQVEVTGSVILTVWVCLGFSSARLTGLDPNGFVQSLSADWQACLLPLPFAPQTPPASRRASPVSFGNQLHIGGFLARKPCFLNIGTVPVAISDNVPFKRFVPPGFLSREEMRQINRYTATSPAIRPSISHSYGPAGGSDAAGNLPPGTLSTPLPPPPPPGPSHTTPSSSGPTQNSWEWYQNIPELADALPAADAGSDDDDDTSENEYTLMDYMRFSAPGQRAVQGAFEKQLVADAVRLKRRVAEWASSVAMY